MFKAWVIRKGVVFPAIHEFRQGGNGLNIRLGQDPVRCGKKQGNYSPD